MARRKRALERRDPAAHQRLTAFVVAGVPLGCANVHARERRRRVICAELALDERKPFAGERNGAIRLPAQT